MGIAPRTFHRIKIMEGGAKQNTLLQGLPGLAIDVKQPDFVEEIGRLHGPKSSIALAMRFKSLCQIVGCALTANKRAYIKWKPFSFRDPSHPNLYAMHFAS